MITKTIRNIFKILQFYKKYGENAFRVGNGNFQNSKLIEGLVILNKKGSQTRKKKKVHRIIGSFFYSSRCKHAHDRFSTLHCTQSFVAGAAKTTGAGASYSITGEIDMGCETETSIVKCVLIDRVMTGETRLALLVRILWLLCTCSHAARAAWARSGS